jgi:hypothetical protein
MQRIISWPYVMCRRIEVQTIVHLQCESESRRMGPQIEMWKLPPQSVMIEPAFPPVARDAYSNSVINCLKSDSGK